MSVCSDEEAEMLIETEPSPSVNAASSLGDTGNINFTSKVNRGNSVTISERGNPLCESTTTY